jgi:hypothetical protein
MGNARTIASLLARRRRLILGLQDFDRRAAVYRSSIAEVEARLQTLLPLVAPYVPRKRCPHFTARELNRGCQDALREREGRALVVDEIVTFLMRRKGLDIQDSTLRKGIQRRVRDVLRRMR